MIETCIIGFGHKKQTGKSTAASELGYYLIEQGYTIELVAFADSLYEICNKLYSWAGFETKRFYDKHPEMKQIILENIGKSPRQILIDFGTKAVREQVYERTWVDYLLYRNSYTDFLLISDVRFPNEFQAIRDRGGFLIKVVRPQIMDTHDVADDAINETFLWDLTIINDGTIPQLRNKLIDGTKIFLRQSTNLKKSY